MKERFKVTELQREANRVSFGKMDGGDFADEAMGLGLGHLGAGAGKRLRGAAASEWPRGPERTLPRRPGRSSDGEPAAPRSRSSLCALASQARAHMHSSFATGIFDVSAWAK